MPPSAPDAFELLRTRITFDLTGKNAEKRMGYGALGATAGCAILGVRLGGTNTDFVVAAVIWVVLMVICGIGFGVNRRRNARAAARLRAAGFVPVTDAGGQVRYLTPAMAAGHGQNPYGAGIPPQAPGPYGPRGPSGGAPTARTARDSPALPPAAARTVRPAPARAVRAAAGIPPQQPYPQQHAAAPAPAVPPGPPPAAPGSVPAAASPALRAAAPELSARGDLSPGLRAR